MEIRQLDAAAYAGRRFTAHYQTRGYYDISASDGGFHIQYVPFEAVMQKSVDDVFFGEWLEAPVALGAFGGER